MEEGRVRSIGNGSGSGGGGPTATGDAAAAAGLTRQPTVPRLYIRMSYLSRVILREMLDVDAQAAGCHASELFVTLATFIDVYSLPSATVMTPLPRHHDDGGCADSGAVAPHAAGGHSRVFKPGPCAGSVARQARVAKGQADVEFRRQLAPHEGSHNLGTILAN